MRPEPPRARSLRVDVGLAAITVSAIFGYACGLVGFVQALALLGTAVIAIPHGALDFVLARQAFGSGAGRRLAFYAVYVALALVVVALWALAPTAALWFFLGASAHHFGEAELQHLGRTGRVRIALFWSRGAAILAVALLVHADSIAPVLAALGVPPELVTPEHGELWAAFSVALHAAILSLALRRRRRYELVVFAIVVALFVALPPVLSLPLYLALWHAPAHVSAFVRREGVRQRWGRLLLGVYGLTALSLLGGVALAAGQPQFQDPVAWQARAVIFISALTLPHLVTVARWGAAWRWAHSRGRSA